MDSNPAALCVQHVILTGPDANHTPPSDSLTSTPFLCPPFSAFSEASHSANFVVIPMLAQRLLINMRKVDYMGSQPLASKLLFAPPLSGTEDSLNSDFTRSIDVGDEASDGPRRVSDVRASGEHVEKV